MNKNERLAHLEATVATLVNQVKSLEETRIADDALMDDGLRPTLCGHRLLGMHCEKYIGHDSYGPGGPHQSAAATHMVTYGGIKIWWQAL